MKPTIKIDTKALAETFREYERLTKRGIADDLNQKGFSIVTDALKLTAKASAATIRRYLSRDSRTAAGVPVAAILVNTFRRRNGDKGLRGAEMKAAVATLKNKKVSHANFLRLGWSAAVADYASRIGKASGKSVTRLASKFGKRGGAKLAKTSINPFTEFWHTAFSKVTTTKQGIRIAEAGLAKAIVRQIADMRKYIARKQGERAKQAFRRFLR